MTQKELLYMEDATEHEKNLIDIYNFTIESLTDEDLIKFVKKHLKKHEEMKQKLLNELESAANE